MLWFDKTEASTQRNLAQGHIQRAIAAGRTGAQVIGTLQKADIWYDSRQFGQDWKYWTEAYDVGSRMAYVNRDSRPSQSLYVESRGLRASKYQTVIEFRGIDTETGEDFTQQITVVHTHEVDGIEMYDEQQIYTRRELEELAQTYFDWYGLGETTQITSIVPVMGYYNPDM